jgi:NAD-dependent dihydropyrimidine dehydrogenase PreA subunit
MAFKIDSNECTGCGTCQSVCPVGCITETSGGVRKIDEDECSGCGLCADNCPIGSIIEN